MVSQETAPATTDSREWITATEAANRKGISGHSFPKVAQAASIRRRQYPGLLPSYNAADVQRLIDQAVTTGPHDPETSNRRPARRQGADQ